MDGLQKVLQKERVIAEKESDCKKEQIRESDCKQLDSVADHCSMYYSNCSLIGALPHSVKHGQ